MLLKGACMSSINNNLIKPSELSILPSYIQENDEQKYRDWLSGNEYAFENYNYIYPEPLPLEVLEQDLANIESQIKEKAALIDADNVDQLQLLSELEILELEALKITTQIVTMQQENEFSAPVIWKPNIADKDELEALQKQISNDPNIDLDFDIITLEGQDWREVYKTINLHLKEQNLSSDMLTYLDQYLSKYGK